MLPGHGARDEQRGGKDLRCHGDEVGQQPETHRQPPFLLKWSSVQDAGHITGISGKWGDSTYLTGCHENQLRKLCGLLESRCHQVGAKQMSSGVQRGEIQDPAVNTVPLECPAPEPLSSARSPAFPPPDL